MKTRLIKFIAWLGLLAGLIPTAWANYSWEFNPHVGIDFKYWDVEGRVSPYSYDKYFPEVTLAGAFYIGTRINKNWGIDLGYERSKTKEKFHTFEIATTPFGTTSNIGDQTDIDIRLEAWYLSGLFYWEIVENLEAVFHAGLVVLDPMSKILYYDINQGPIEYRFDLSSRWGGRFGLGAQYLMLCRHLGIRAILTWDPTRRINYVGLNHNLTYLDINPYKGALSYNAGLFFEW